MANAMLGDGGSGVGSSGSFHRMMMEDDVVTNDWDVELTNPHPATTTMVPGVASSSNSSAGSSYTTISAAVAAAAAAMTIDDDTTNEPLVVADPSNQPVQQQQQQPIQQQPSTNTLLLSSFRPSRIFSSSLLLAPISTTPLASPILRKDTIIPAGSNGTAAMDANGTMPEDPPKPPAGATVASSPPSNMNHPNRKPLSSRKSVDFAILPPSPKRTRQYSQQQLQPHYHDDEQQYHPNSATDGTMHSYSYNANSNTNMIASSTNSNDCCWTAKQVVDAISTCICASERMEAIVNAIESLNHNNQELHNEEMSTGIDSAMTKHLTFLVYQYNLQKQLKLSQPPTKKQRSNSKDMIIDDDEGNSGTIQNDDTDQNYNQYRKEISLTLEAMESLYRASSQIVEVSFQRMGNELVQLLLCLLEDEINHRIVLINNFINNQQQQQQKLLLLQREKEQQKEQLNDKTAMTVNATPVNGNTNSSNENNGIIRVNNPLAPPPQLPTTTAAIRRLSITGTNHVAPVSTIPNQPAICNGIKQATTKTSGGDSASSICISHSKNDDEQPRTDGPLSAEKHNPTSDSSCNDVPLVTAAGICNDDVDGDLLLRKATKLLAHLARVANATKTIAHYPGLLGTLVNIISIRPYDCIPWEARLSTLWTIGNLACDRDNMTMMACMPNLIAALIDVANRKFVTRVRHHQQDEQGQLLLSSARSTTDAYDVDHKTNNVTMISTVPTSLETTMEILRSRSIASRAILNLSWAPENKIILSEIPDLLDLLCCLLTTTRTSSTSTCGINASSNSSNDDRNDTKNESSFVPLCYSKSKTVQDIQITTRRHASGALRNLAAAPRRIKIQLCNYKNGHILHVLTDAALHDPDPSVQEHVFGTIHNLANQDTAEKIVNNPALVLALKGILSSGRTSDDTHAASSSAATTLWNDGRNNSDNSINAHGEYNPEISALLRKPSPKEHASATLTILERSITSDMDAYESLRDLLDAVHPSGTSSDELCNPTNDSNQNIDGDLVDQTSRKSIASSNSSYDGNSNNNNGNNSNLSSQSSVDNMNYNGTKIAAV